MHGLSEAEASQRLAVDGPNELVRQRQRSVMRILIEVMREPMLALLVGGGVVYLLLGDVHEALILLVFAGLSIVITVAQEARTERSLEALRDLTSPRALVIRRRIPGREVVCGDLVLLGEGDRVPADGLIVENEGLEADESLLTGESVPVRKAHATAGQDLVMERPGGDGRPFAFSGTLVVRGSGLVRVMATGERSEIGRIGRELSGIEAETPRLQVQTRRLVWWMAIGGGGASLLCVLLYGILRGSWLDAALAGIALGMSMLPEEFPLVLTVFMAMGAMRMSQVRVLTRRAAAIETLGAATVLCTDKTGTLTENRMRIAELRLPDGRIVEHDGGSLSLDEDFRILGELGILASAEQPVDPMEQAFHALGDSYAGGRLRYRQQQGWRLRHYYPLDPRLLAMSHVWSNEGPDEHVIATKGAPEAIAELCHMDEQQLAALRSEVDKMATSGLRVLGIAEARWSDGHALPLAARLCLCLPGTGRAR
jgi:Ca2+-transporting ATPase